MFAKIIRGVSVIVLCIIFCLAYSETSHIDIPLWLVPLVYSLFTFCISSNDFKTPGMAVLQFAMLGRYLLMPLSIYLDDTYKIFALNYNYMDGALYLMLYELVAVIIAILISKKYISKKFLKKTKLSSFVFNMKGGDKLIFFFSLLAIFILMKNEYLLRGFSLILTGISDVTSEDVEGVSGGIGLFWNATISWIFIYACFKIKGKKIGSSAVIIAAFLFLLIGFLGQTRISRWSTVIKFVAIFFFLIKMFPTYKKNFLIKLAIPVSALLLTASLYKNSDYLSGDDSVASGMSNLVSQEILQAYFCGPTSINNAIGMKEMVNPTIYSLPFDIMNNMPLVLHFVDRSNATVNMYNKYIGRDHHGIEGDQIIPLIGQSSIYFGYLLSPLLSVIFVFLVRYFDKKYLLSQSAMTYVYAFLGAWTAVCMMMMNLTVYLATFYVNILPLWFFFILTNFVGKLKFK